MIMQGMIEICKTPVRVCGTGVSVVEWLRGNVTVLFLPMKQLRQIPDRRAAVGQHGRCVDGEWLK